MAATSTITIQQALDTILSAAAVKQLAETVDTVKTGDPSRPLTGVVTTFLATGAVIARAAELGANLVITHEPTFYTHLDETDWLAEDTVYRAKARLIDSHGIVIWRFHDYWHRTRPDGILTGVIERLGWEPDPLAEYPHVASLPPLRLADLGARIKEQLDATVVRIAGPDDLVVGRIGLVVGAPGGKRQIGALQRADVDAIICGEINEWEVSEYVRDATFFGRPKGLLVVGHAASEEAGMAYLAEWLRPRLPGVAITHVPAGDALRVI